MSYAAILVIVIFTAIGIIFWGFIQRWSFKKIFAYVIITSLLIAPLALLDNYRIFIIAILLAVFFEYKRH